MAKHSRRRDLDLFGGGEGGSTERRFTVALAGNPNVGKSTVFNALTGMHQHTGNWPGKTVLNSVGRFSSGRRDYTLVDLPGTYSLSAHSAEEKVARDYICFEGPDAVIAVCDATCLERNLNLVLQIAEITPNLIVCVNMMDEAERKGIFIDIKRLERCLGVPVVGVSAQKKATLRRLIDALDGFEPRDEKPFDLRYSVEIENAISMVLPAVGRIFDGRVDKRWVALKLLDPDPDFEDGVYDMLGVDPVDDGELQNALVTAKNYLSRAGIDGDGIKDVTVSAIVAEAERIVGECVKSKGSGYSSFDRRLDRIVTGKVFGFPIMILSLAAIFWLSIAGANYPSEVLSRLLFGFEGVLSDFFLRLGVSERLVGMVIGGSYHTLAWVVSVMLPPMAIFFPLFTLLEDAGFLPRIAYNLDRPFKRCDACGKQSLTMCMGFGCNAVGVTGARIIDSKRERLLAAITNGFVPCNGRFPALIALSTLLFAGAAGAYGSLPAVAMLTVIIIVAVMMTFAATKFLSSTLLKGVPSSFTLELPPYRRPQFLQVLIRSILDRTVFVLGRAAAVAAPAGLLIWIAANTAEGEGSLLSAAAEFIDPIGRVMGLDGVILLSFILGLPANEIVLPIMIMIYSSNGVLTDGIGIESMGAIFVSNGWTPVTVICTLIFMMFHWPCSTTLLTVKRETGSFKWTAVAALLPTAAGAGICVIINALSKLFI